MLIDTGKVLFNAKVKLRLSNNKPAQQKIDSLPVQPNFYRINYYYVDDLTKETFGGKINFGVNPTEIDYESDIPEDFDDFWKHSVDSLKLIPPKFAISKQENFSTKSHSVQLIEMQSFNNITIYGYFKKPIIKAYDKIILHFGGYSGNLSPKKEFFLDDIAVFVVSIRGHGLSKKDFNPGFKNHEFLTYGIQDNYSFSYRGGILDAIRAIDFVYYFNKKNNEEVAVYINGGSQGAGIALAATALDKRIKGCMVDIPFLTNFRNSFKIAPWPYAVYKKYSLEYNYSIESILRTLDYFDTKNFFPKINVPVLISIGLQDNICPPRTAFSLINQDKKSLVEYKIYPKSGHGLPSTHFLYKINWLKEKFN